VTFKALALDYDGTLASHDRIGPEALDALRQARAAGLCLVLVTGRTFFDLIRVCEGLGLFDAVVVENGGVLYFPPTGEIRDLAPPPPDRLLAELDRMDVPFQLAGAGPDRRPLRRGLSRGRHGRPRRLVLEEGG
jgi:hydroxymethylpyrimidine pyrophosphatase-like HAD family hydrolase